MGTLSPIRRAPTTSAGRVVGVIPARLASTRLPRKVLRNLLGEPLLAWVYRAAIACPELDEVIVAADSDEVAQLCTAARLALHPHLARSSQWHRPPLSPSRARSTPTSTSTSRATNRCSTRSTSPRCSRPSRNPASTSPPSRSAARPRTSPTPTPSRSSPPPTAARSTSPAPPSPTTATPTATPSTGSTSASTPTASSALARFAALPPGTLEQTERLEQLRLLENGIALYVAETTHDTIGVDTEEDLLRVEAILRQR